MHMGNLEHDTRPSQREIEQRRADDQPWIDGTPKETAVHSAMIE